MNLGGEGGGASSPPVYLPLPPKRWIDSNVVAPVAAAADISSSYGYRCPPVTVPYKSHGPTKNDNADDSSACQGIIGALEAVVDRYLHDTAPSTLEDGGSKKKRKKRTKDGIWFQVNIFGSRALGGHISGGDIDLVLFLPTSCDFDLFGAFADKYLPQAGATVKCKVKVARVPLLKLVWEGYDVDILYVAFNLTEPPTETEVRRSTIFDTLAPNTKTSINGVRTVLELRSRVANQEIFATALKRIKEWAIARDLYGTNYTFPAGVGVAVMLTRVYMENRSCRTSEELVRKFFLFFARYFRKVAAWKEGGNAIDPIYVTETYLPQGQEVGVRVPQLEAWDPEKGANDLFVVLNPAFPYVNTCRGVGSSSFARFVSEVCRVEEMLGNHTEKAYLRQWRRALTPVSDECDSWPDSLVMEVSTASMAEYSYEWLGFLESRFRFFVYALESTLPSALELCVHTARLHLPRPQGAAGCRFVIRVREKPSSLAFDGTDRNSSGTERKENVGSSTCCRVIDDDNPAVREAVQKAWNEFLKCITVSEGGSTSSSTREGPEREMNAAFSRAMKVAPPQLTVLPTNDVFVLSLASRKRGRDDL